MSRLSDIFLPGAPPVVIAEVALGHDGSLGLAHAFVDAAAAAGADAVKFQTHIAEAESTPREAFRIPFSYADGSRFDYWKRTSFDREGWAGLKRHAEEKGLSFLSSPFSVEAVELLESLGVEAWKVPSGELGSRGMLDRMAATGKPLLVSTGMSPLSEVDALAAWLSRSCPGRFALFQCTTQYPSRPETVGLNVLDAYRERYGCPVGLSDHSGTPWPSVVAAWLGASVIEAHITLSRRMFGPDVSSSLETGEFARLVEGVRFAHAMRENPVDKDALAREKAPLKVLFGKSAVAARPLSAGEVLSRGDAAFRKPGGGIPEGELDPFYGRRLRRAVAPGEEFKREDFE
jgi:N-acetylneuraminate synthase